MIGCETARRDALCSAIALAHLYGGLMCLEEGVKTLLELRGERVASGENTLEAGQVELFKSVYSEKRFKQRGYARDEIGLIPGQKLCICLWGKLRNENTLTAVYEHGVYAHAETEAVEHGHYRKHLVARGKHRICRNYLGAQSIKVEV